MRPITVRELTQLTYEILKVERRLRTVRVTENRKALPVSGVCHDDGRVMPVTTVA